MEDQQQEMSQEEALAQAMGMLNGGNDEPVTEAPPQEVEAQSAQPSPAQESPQRSPEGEGGSPEGLEPSSARDKYQQHLNRLLEQNREAVQKRQEQSQQQQELEFARQLAEARKYGPEAVKRLLGLQEEERQAQPQYDLRELLGLDDPESDADKTTKELKAKIDKLESFIQDQTKKQEEYFQKQQEEQQRQQMTQWERQQYSEIEGFLQQNSDKYEYVASLKELGSTKDLYDGIITMYQQGYEVTYDDMAQLIEARVESLAETLLDTPKFRKTLEQKYGVKLAPQPQKVSKTIGGSMVAESGTVSHQPAEETDEENQARALKEAMAAKERAQAALKQRLG